MKSQCTNYYVYIHRDLITKEVLYVGKCSGKRAYVKRNERGNI